MGQQGLGLRLNLHDFFVTLEREALEKKYGYDAYIYSLFSTLFLRLLRIWHCQGICFNPESISESEEQSMQDILVSTAIPRKTSISRHWHINTT